MSKLALYISLIFILTSCAYYQAEMDKIAKNPSISDIAGKWYGYEAKDGGAYFAALQVNNDGTAIFTVQHMGFPADICFINEVKKSGEEFSMEYECTSSEHTTIRVITKEMIELYDANEKVRYITLFRYEKINGAFKTLETILIKGN